MPAAPLLKNAASPRIIGYFATAIREVLSTMAGVPVEVGDIDIKVEPVAAYDVSGIIGFSGAFAGSMAINFPLVTAGRIVAAFAGGPVTTNSPDFADAIGELANLVAGAAKRSFGAATWITVPSVIVGSGHTIARLHDVPCYLIPCRCSAGEFFIEVSIMPQPDKSLKGVTQS